MNSLEEIYRNALLYIYRSTCINRSYCAIIINENGIQSYGYSHAPTSFLDCKTSNICKRNDYKKKYSEYAEFFEVCQVIHAEMDALIKMNPDQMTAYTKIYLLGIDNATEHVYANAAPCEICRKLLIEVGFTCIFVFQSTTEVKEINLF